MKKNLKNLQNGTDIRGVAYENDKFDVNLTDNNIRAIAKGIYEWISKNKKDNIKIAIGRDSRITGEKILKLLSFELNKLGVEVLNCKIATTPAMFMMTIWEKYNCDCGIMITASHLPYFYNGIKLFTKAGAVEKSDITEILTFAEKKYFDFEPIDFDSLDLNIKELELIEDYSNFIINNIREKTQEEKPFNDFKIVVDAGNGAGGFFANKVLKVLGADVSCSQFLEPDGMFPNHEPNPENKEAMLSLKNRVIDTKSDLGIIFDTDVDRAGLVTDDGQEINRNSLIAMISKVVLRDYPNSTIVTDSITSNGLTEFIEKNGGVHHRFKRGYKNVINESKRINKEANSIKSHLAIETSGHGAMHENYFLDDGTYLVSRLLIESSKLKKESKKLQDLISDLKNPLESKEIRLKITKENFKEYGEKVLEEFKKFAISQKWDIVNPNYEGVKASFDGGWILIRMSLHEPVMPVNIETDKDGLLNSIIELLNRFVGEQDGIKF